MTSGQGIHELELALTNERAYSRQIYEYANRLSRAYQELQRTELSLRNQVASTRNRDTETDAANTKLRAELDEVRAELSRYRRAWSDILTREKEAESIISESQRIRARIDELEAENRSLYQQQVTDQSRVEQERRRLEDHYRSELQNALIRLHATEGKFDEAVRELQALAQLRESEQRTARQSEEKLRWELQNQILREREKATSSFDDATRKMKEEFSRESEHIRVEFNRVLSEEKRLANEGLAKALTEKDEALQVLRSEVTEAREAHRLELETARRDAELATSSVGELIQRLNGELASVPALKDELGRTRGLVDLKNGEIRGIEERATKAQGEVTRLQARERELTERLQARERELTERLQARERELTERLQAREKELQDEAARSESEIRAQASSLEKALVARFEAREKELLAAVSAQAHKLRAAESREEEARAKASSREKELQSDAVEREKEFQAQAAEREEGIRAKAAANEEAVRAEAAASEEKLRAEAAAREEELLAEAAATERKLAQELENKEAAFQELCETLVRAQNAVTAAEAEQDRQRVVATEATARLERRDATIAALADECELLRKILAAEKRGMRELFLRLGSELRARKAGVELNAEALQAILADSDIPVIPSEPCV